MAERTTPDTLAVLECHAFAMVLSAPPILSPGHLRALDTLRACRPTHTSERPLVDVLDVLEAVTVGDFPGDGVLVIAGVPLDASLVTAHVARAITVDPHASVLHDEVHVGVVSALDPRLVMLCGTGWRIAVMGMDQAPPDAIELPLRPWRRALSVVADG